MSNKYLPAFLYLPSTTLLLRASARELPVPFLTPLVWRGRGANPRPSDPEADALTTRLSGPVTTKLICVFVFAYAKIRFSHDAAQFENSVEPDQTSHLSLPVVCSDLCCSKRHII